MICISIVSHGHAKMLPKLIGQILRCQDVNQVIVTFNISEQVDLPADKRMQYIFNPSPRGFGSNHNHAFKFCTETFFCVLNPDIDLQINPFPRLLSTVKKYRAALIAPLIVNFQGKVEDSIRYFPAFHSLIGKLLFGKEHCYSINDHTLPFSPEWVAGMFMLFKSNVFERLHGFDERYFLYYEDVDICIRVWRLNLRIYVDPSVSIIHNARRDSRKNFLFMKTHLRSMAIYLFFNIWRLPNIKIIIDEKK